MKHKNRIAALMLSLTLCIGAFAVPASALSEEDGSVEAETVETEEVEETADESPEEPTQEAEPEEAPAEEFAPETEPEPVTGEQEDAELIDNGLTPEGNLSLVDDYGSATGEGKQFITLVTKSGNYFYLMIDRDSDGDQTVHFLNQVDEADLLALMDEDTAEAYGNHAEEAPTPEETPEEPEPTVTPASTEQTSAKSSSALPSLMLLGAVAVGGIVFALTGRKRKKAAQQVRPDPDADYEMESGYEFPEENMDDA